jgi:DNA repair exonuclease SbcCD ATPase subunit
MLASFLQRQDGDATEQLLKLYWNRAGVKRELKDLRGQHLELLDKLKEQEGAILRAQEQLEGLERLLTNPLAAANAMVYFQLRHMWRVAAQRLAQFGAELQTQRERRERAQLHEAALGKRKRRIGAINEKLQSLIAKRRNVIQEASRLEQELQGMNPLLRLFRGSRAKRRIAGFVSGRAVLEEKLEELKDLKEKIQGEPLPEPQGLSLESRRLINTAVIALAQHLVLHFSEHDLASLAKTATDRPVGDMKFGDRRDCDRMVERIRERIEDLRRERNLADKVKRRADHLKSELKYRNENDSLPVLECIDAIFPAMGEPPDADRPLARRTSDAPLRINVLADEYWDIFAVLR